jgi:hypothetical protein
MYIGLQVQYRLLVFRCSTGYFQILIKLEFSRRISEKYSNYQISWKSIQWERSCSMRADGRTDMTKQMVNFRNFLSRVNASHHLLYIVYTNWLPNTILITVMLDLLWTITVWYKRHWPTCVFPEHANCHEMSPAGARSWCSSVLCSEIVSQDALHRACLMTFRGFTCSDCYVRYP